MTQSLTTEDTVINGVTRTVHEKRPHAAHGSIMPAPAVAAAAPQKPFRTIKEMVETVAEHVESTCGAGYGVRGTLHNYPLHFLEELYELFQNDDNAEITSATATQINTGESYRYMKECAHFYPKAGITDYLEAASYVRSLREYTEFRYSYNLTTIDETKEEQCLAIITATRRMRYDFPAVTDDPTSPLRSPAAGKSRAMSVIKNNGIVKLIMSNPTQAEAIGSLAGTGMTARSIQAVLDGAYPALAEGAL